MRTIHKQTDMFLGFPQKKREIPRSRRLLRIVPLEERSFLSVSDGENNTAYDTATLAEYLNDPNNHTGYSQVLKTTEYTIDGETRTVTKETCYTIGLEQISQTITTSEGTVSHFFTYDCHGSTRTLLDATAVIMQLYSFDAYGNAIGFNPAEATTEYLYSGE